jgi:hypothetical protein
LLQAVAPGLFVRRVHQDAVHVEDRASETHGLSFLASS